MKILAVSDVQSPALESHFDSDYWRGVGIDLIVSCGDLSVEYLSYLGDAFNRPIAYVRGNHDTGTARAPVGENLDRRVTKFGDLTFLGLEGSVAFNGDRAQYTESQMALRIALLRPRLWLARQLDVVVAHSAPQFCEHAYRTCDKPEGVGGRCPYYTNLETGEPRTCLDASDHAHRGFECFRELILRYQPRYFLHGHRHRTYGMGKRELMIGNTRVIDTYGHVVLDI